MYLAHYDEDTGGILGFYLPDLHKSIPQPVVELSAEQHAAYFAGEQSYKVIEGAFTQVEKTAPKLEEVKSAKWEEVKVKRNQLEQAGCPYMGGVLDTDQVSIQRVAIAVQAAQAAIGMGVEFTLDWTMQDNSIVGMTAQEVCGMPLTLALYSNQLHTTARGLRQQIEAAASAEEVAAIVWAEEA